MIIINNLLLKYLYMDLIFLMDIFKYKYLNNGLLVHCHKNTILNEIQKIFIINNIRINSIRIGDEDREFKNNPFRVGIFVNTSCDGWDNFINHINIKEKFRFPHVWIFFAEDITSITNVLNNIPIEIDSDIIVVDKNDLYDVYNTGFEKNGKLIVKHIATRNEVFKIIERNNRNDLNGVQLKCAVVVMSENELVTIGDYLKKEKTKTRVFDSIHRLKYLIVLDYLQDMYNLTYKFLPTASWGYRHNGSFDGMVGALERNEADIGGSPIFFRSDRNEIIDYTAQVWPSRHSFIFRHPKNPNNFYTLYTRPLSVTVWYCVLSMFVFSGVLLYLMFRLRIYIEGELEEDASFSLAILLIWSALCQQGIFLERKSSSIKIVLFITLIYTVLLYTYYNGVVVSTLLMETPKSIRTLNDLLNSDLRVGDEDALYDRDYFERTTDPVATELYHKKIKVGDKENFFKPEDGMALVKRGGFAFHVDTIVSYGIIKSKFSDREICEIQEVTMYAYNNLGAVMRKRSPYRNHLAYAIRKIMESGLLQRIRWDWDEPKPRCMKIPDTSLFSVSIIEFSTPLIILAFGFIASLILLAFEILL